MHCLSSANSAKWKTSKLCIHSFILALQNNSIMVETKTTLTRRQRAKQRQDESKERGAAVTAARQAKQAKRNQQKKRAAQQKRTNKRKGLLNKRKRQHLLHLLHQKQRRRHQQRQRCRLQQQRGRWYRRQKQQRGGCLLHQPKYKNKKEAGALKQQWADCHLSCCQDDFNTQRPCQDDSKKSDSACASPSDYWRETPVGGIIWHRIREIQGWGSSWNSTSDSWDWEAPPIKRLQENCRHRIKEWQISGRNQTKHQIAVFKRLLEQFLQMPNMSLIGNICNFELSLSLIDIRNRYERSQNLTLFNVLRSSCGFVVSNW